jgi:hypothetical protein
VLFSPSKEGTGIGAAGAITQFLRLTFLRPIERFLGQVISISTDPTAFVRERIHLGDTTYFLRAVGFFVSAISTAFLAEVATLYLLGIGDLTEPYYWTFILLDLDPFRSRLLLARQTCCTGYRSRMCCTSRSTPSVRESLWALSLR